MPPASRPTVWRDRLAEATDSTAARCTSIRVRPGPRSVSLGCGTARPRVIDPNSSWRRPGWPRRGRRLSAAPYAATFSSGPCRTLSAGIRETVADWWSRLAELRECTTSCPTLVIAISAGAVRARMLTRWTDDLSRASRRRGDVLLVGGVRDIRRAACACRRTGAARGLGRDRDQPQPTDGRRLAAAARTARADRHERRRGTAGSRGRSG